NLAVAANGDVLVLSSQGPEGTVYWFQPGSPSTELNVIPPTAAVPHANATTLLPGNWWNNAEFKDQYDAASDRFTTLAELFAQEVAKPKPREYVSPDGSLVLPAFRTFQQGPPNHLGWRWSDALQSYGFVGGKSGQRVLVSNESEAKIYSAMVGESGALTQLKPLFNRGGESVAVDGEGNVYVANGQIFVLDPTGKQLGVIEVPERPLQLVVGGDDSHTLFVLTHHSLYALKL
ncbi:MAG TPA: SMP-30/gluconolactonase/LRE family protein, partial [Candidatus Acidoferrum sp.]|nr:SMP-30/gluconolactonase/LRE family protein [Candidatus Acidoferrum sp.]